MIEQLAEVQFYDVPEQVKHTKLHGWQMCGIDEDMYWPSGQVWEHEVVPIAR